MNAVKLSVEKFSKICGIVVLIAAYPLAMVLPVSISFENALIENLQVLVLFLNGLYFLFLSRKNFQRVFCLWSCILSFFMMCRELSWGRVFYQIKMEDLGPVFIGMEDYAWKTEVHIFIVAVIIILLLMLKKIPLRRFLKIFPPLKIIFFMVVAVIFSYTGEKGFFMSKANGQILEEISELAFYLFIPALFTYYYKRL